MSIVENPPEKLKATWGTLAHVTEKERQRILGPSLWPVWRGT